MARKQTTHPKPDVTQKLEPPAGRRPRSGPARSVCWLEERSRMVAEAAYFRAERRGFAPGGELDDWIRAEAEIDRMIQSGGSRSSHSSAGV